MWGSVLALWEPASFGLDVSNTLLDFRRLLRVNVGYNYYVHLPLSILVVVLDTSDPSWTCTLRWTWPSVSVVDNVVVQVPGQACRTPWRWGSPSGSLDEVYIRAPTCCMDRVWGIQFRVSPTTDPHVVLLGWLVPRLSHGSFSSLVYTAPNRASFS